MRRLGLVAVAIAVALTAPTTTAHGQVEVPGPTGPDFAALLLADAAVVPAIKAALRDGRATAQPVAFGDLTADGTSDAVVVVASPGAAGAVAAYVFSTLDRRRGSLRVIYRSQSLYRALVRVSRGALTVLTPDYARGDDVCCAAATLQRTYVYSRTTRQFARTDARRIPRATG